VQAALGLLPDIQLLYGASMERQWSNTYLRSAGITGDRISS
jgi:hypothetical protein